MLVIIFNIGHFIDLDIKQGFLLSLVRNEVSKERQNNHTRVNSEATEFDPPSTPLWRPKYEHTLEIYCTQNIKG